MVCDIEEKMPPDEVVYWIAYFDLKHAKMKKEAEKAKQQNGNQVRSKRYR
jgi:hypothetical protein